jgi:hypothetical protein
VAVIEYQNPSSVDSVLNSVLVSSGPPEVRQEIICLSDAVTPSQIAKVTPAGAVMVDGSAATQPVSGTFFQATQPVSGTVAVSNFPSSQVVTLASTTITGSVAVTGTFWQTTQPVSLASTTITGTVAVTQSTSPWIVAGGGTAGSPGTAVLTVQGISGGTAVPISGAVTVASTTITGTVAVTQSTSPWVVSLASTTLTGTSAVAGALTNNNAAPAATNLGVLPAIAETTYATVTYVTGNQVLPVTDLHGALNQDLQAYAGTALGAPTNFGTTPGAVIVGQVNASLFVGTVVAVAASAGVQKVGISGATGVTLDAVITAATAPANGLAILSVNTTTPPSLTTGQSVALQSDYEGSIFVKPYRRSETVAQATTISLSSSATTVLAAQAAGIFADISALVVTVTPAASTALVFTITLSDGTQSYIYDMDTGITATPSATGTINFTFDPPLPATTAATVWTIAASLATVVLHITVVAVKQKAS